MRCALLLVPLAACSIAPIDYTGKECSSTGACPTGYTCNLATQTCTKDDTMIDAPGRDDSMIDAPSATKSCFANPRTKLVYSSPGLSDFPAGWTNGPGTWETLGNGVQQKNSTYSAAWLSHTIPTTNANYRIVMTMRRLDNGGPIGIAFRVGAMGPGIVLYACALNPEAGALSLYYIQQGTPGLMNSRPVSGVGSLATFTMEINANESSLSCCIQDHDSLLSVPNGPLTMGGAGPATFDTEGLFTSIYAYE